MTVQTDILNDEKYIPCLDYGFVGLVDSMGSDQAIVQAARVSYGAGTKSVRQDRGLIRYLIRHKHTSPVEMCVVKLHLKLPIFVMRQLVRHRTSSLNEYSGRYSVMSDEFYIPDFENIKPQSEDNKQGRAGDTDDISKSGVQWLMKAAHDHSYSTYKALLGERPVDENGRDATIYDLYDEADPVFSNEFTGVARELARTVLPVGNYTELYWKQDLHNLFHMLRLRMDAHAQYEIRVFADAIYKLVQPLFPLACEAFEDYVNGAVTLSRMEHELMIAMLQNDGGRLIRTGIETQGSVKAFAEEWGMSERELREFVDRFKLGEYLA